MSLIGIKYRLGQAWSLASYAARGAGDYSGLFGHKNGHAPAVGSVMVGRNDDYMPDFAERLAVTIEWNSRHLVTEPIFIEWNPPPDRELLASSLVRRFPTLKVFVVPKELHDRVCHNPKLPLMEYHAKNVGIRRAQSDWVIATNADVALAPDTVRACKSLIKQPDLALTAERIDINWSDFRREGINLKDCIRYKRIIPYVMHGTGDFLMAGRELWHKIRGYDESLLKHRIGCDVRGAAQMIAHGAHINKIGKILHLAHPTSCTEGVQDHHGEYAPTDGLPYLNDEDWGLGNCREIEIGERIWRLE